VLHFVWVRLVHAIGHYYLGSYQSVFIFGSIFMLSMYNPTATVLYDEFPCAPSVHVSVSFESDRNVTAYLVQINNEC
jgi:hypothetical protein